LHLFINGSKLTGRMTGRADSNDIADVTINGDILMWKASIKFQCSITFEFSVKVDGGSMTGAVKLGPLGKPSLIGTRS
jgi:hypothetical protein